MTTEKVPTEVASYISGIVKGQKQTSQQLNNIIKSLAEIEKQQESDLKDLSYTFTALKTFNDTLSAVNNRFDEMNRATNTHFETQMQMNSFMNDVAAAQKSTYDLYEQIRDDAKKQKSLHDECIQESYSGTIKLLQKQQTLGESFNQICDAVEKEKQTLEALVTKFKEALDAFPAALHKIYGK